MINKTKKYFLNLLRIRDLKYISTLTRILKPIFFIKYLLLIFAVPGLIYLTVPVFFDFTKKDYFIKNVLIKNYNINLNDYTSIKYNFLPTPRITITKANLNIKNQIIKKDINNLILLVNLVDVYNFKKLRIKKVIFNNSNFNLEVNNYKKFLQYIIELKSTIIIKNSNIFVVNENKKIFNLKQVNFDNTNLDKLLLSGLLSEKKFILKFSKNLKNKQLSINIPKIGSKTDIFFSENSNIDVYNGKIKSKLLNNNFNFEFKKKEYFTIYNSSYRNNLIQTSFDGDVKFNPFFLINLDFNIKDIKLKKIIDRLLNKTINITSIFNKKINGSFNVTLNGKNLNSKFLKKVNINSILENGSLQFKDSSFVFSAGDVNFSGELSSVDGYQKLNFDLNGKIIDKNILLKKIDIKLKKKENNPLEYKIVGYINLDSSRIYFKKILIGKGYLATQQDLDFIKKNFEKFVLKDNYTNLLILSNFKRFINEVY